MGGHWTTLAHKKTFPSQPGARFPCIGGGSHKMIALVRWGPSREQFKSIGIPSLRLIQLLPAIDLDHDRVSPIKPSNIKPFRTLAGVIGWRWFFDLHSIHTKAFLTGYHPPPWKACIQVDPTKYDLEEWEGSDLNYGWAKSHPNLIDIFRWINS